MNCTNLNTAAEILEAFRVCKNPGEEIELFECLATRPDPPVGAFVDILRSIKLEAVLALTIQAFGKITVADIKARLKESQDLLIMLSQQAQSGSSDLIRWSAATTIDNLGFDFIAVSQYLTEEPKKIAEKIVQSKVKRFADRNLVNSNDYDEFVKFWTYGALNRLKETSVGCGLHDSLLNTTCQTVMRYLSLKGIKDINAALQRAELMGDKAFPIDENEIFERSAQFIAEEKLNELGNSEGDYIDLLIEIQLHCLQSNNLLTRKSAAEALSKLANNSLEQLKQSNSAWAAAIFLFTQHWYQYIEYSDNRSKVRYYGHVVSSLPIGATSGQCIPHSTKELEHIASQFQILVQNFSREKVRQDCLQYYKTVVEELQLRKEQARELQVKKIQQFEDRERKSLQLRATIDNNLNEIKTLNLELYNHVFSRVSFDNPPQLSVENEQYSQIFNMYDKSLKEKLASLREPVNNFYDSFISNQLLPIQTKIKIASKASYMVAYMIYNTGIATIILTMIYIFIKSGDLAGAIVIGFMYGGIFAVIVVVVLQLFLGWISNYCESKEKEYETICNCKQSQLENEKSQLLNLLNV